MKKQHYVFSVFVICYIILGIIIISYSSIGWLIILAPIILIIVSLFAILLIGLGVYFGIMFYSKETNREPKMSFKEKLKTEEERQAFCDELEVFLTETKLLYYLDGDGDNLSLYDLLSDIYKGEALAQKEIGNIVDNFYYFITEGKNDKH